MSLSTTKKAMAVNNTTNWSTPAYQAHRLNSDAVNNRSKSAQMQCHHCQLNKHCLNKSLNKENIDVLNTIIRHPKPVHKGDHIYQQDESFSSIYVVHSGAIKTYNTDKEGEEYITGFFLPGEVFGVDGMHQGKYRQSAESLDTTSVCQISINKINNHFSIHPQLQQVLLTALCSDIHERQQPLLILHHKHAEQRLATFLSDISKRHSKRGLSATEFTIPMSRRDIAQYLGMTEETISRLFTRFQNLDLISANRRDIVIRNIEALTNLSLTIH